MFITGTENACLKLIFTKFACSMKKVLVCLTITKCTAVRPMMME